MQGEKTIVVFRRWRARPRTIIALFPGEPADRNGYMCESFEHVGQHGHADYQGVIAATDPVRPDEYASLRRELEGAPYRYTLDIRSRAPRGIHAKRIETARGAA